jgi:hypothetical protein
MPFYAIGSMSERGDVEILDNSRAAKLGKDFIEEGYTSYYALYFPNVSGILI